MLKESKLVYLLNDENEAIVQLAIKEIHDGSNYSWLTKKKYANIEYLGSIEANHSTELEPGIYHLVNFKEAAFNSVERARTFALFVKSCFESSKNSELSNSKILQQIIDYFSKYSKSNDVKSLREDFAVALFVLKCLNIGIGSLVLNALRMDGNQKLFFVNNQNEKLYVKITSFMSSDIKIEDESEKTLDSKNDYVIVKCDFISGGVNILNIFDEIDSKIQLNEVLNSKREKYFYYFDEEFINNETIFDWDFVTMSYYSKNSLPDITINDRKKMKHLIYVMDATSDDSDQELFNNDITNFFKK